MTDLVPAHASDGGPCPICGESMDGKAYETTVIGGAGVKGEKIWVRGRYWHMVNEHDRFEHYEFPY